MGRLTRITVLLISVGLLLQESVVWAAEVSIPRAHRKYLDRLFLDTWNYIDHFVSPHTGLPYDSHDSSRPRTSLTNIGFYMASCAVAHKAGLISRETALSKLTRVLESLHKIETWRGFPVTWVDVNTLQTTERQFSTVDHLGNLSASLVVVKNAFPELGPSVDAILSPMDWGVMYEPKNHFYRGGYRLYEKDFDIHQPWGEWYYSFLGADTRLGSFLGVAKGQVPADHWQALNRGKETKHGQEYYVPGWQGGGLFMQCISGLFLDERSTVLGASAANFAYAQMIHGREIHSPVWGWSAAVAPTGEYLGWGSIKDEVVTPHACALVISYYPGKVIANLKKLEEMGARAPFIEEGKIFEFGFRDSLNCQSGQISPGYLVLDQAMLFLSLANFLRDGVVWRHFQMDPVVRKGLQGIKEYSAGMSNAKDIYARRDEQVPTPGLVLKLDSAAP